MYRLRGDNSAPRKADTGALAKIERELDRLVRSLNPGSPLRCQSFPSWIAVGE
jgi:hypothetical protein